MGCTRIPTAVAAFVFLAGAASAEGVDVFKDGKARVQIFPLADGLEKGPAEVLRVAAHWFADSLSRAGLGKLEIIDKETPEPAIVFATAERFPDVARGAGLKRDDYDAFCIVTGPKRVYVLGNTAAGVRNGATHLLHHLGFRWYAPSPRWHVVPKLRDVHIDMETADAPVLRTRSIWYAYGPNNSEAAANYRVWAQANRLTVNPLTQTGHSYGNIILRNQDEFAKHPEYYALLENGERDAKGPPQARKFCFSNRGLIDLVIADRRRLLAEKRKVDPHAFMVSVDPSDGEGTCHCPECKALGTTTDRVLHLANEVARALGKDDPTAWVGLYAYSSHRLPPTIRVEPNVYVQVAMGFNRTQYSLPELVELWSKKVGAIGLREYYGVEAWDWGLPGRMRGGNVAYHRKWIPYYTERKLNAVNAETNGNWGGQMLGLHVAARLMWNPREDVDNLVEEYFATCFGPAAAPMRRLHARFDEAPQLRAATLLPMFRDVEEAGKLADGDAVRARLTDMMAYLEYVAAFRDFDIVRDQRAGRDDVYYESLQGLMEYVWRIQDRDVVHYMGLARRLCNGLPVGDKRLDFWMFNKERTPVWKTGGPLTDREIRARFVSRMKALEADDAPEASYSRYLDSVRVPGEDSGPARIANNDAAGVTRFRGKLTGYLVPSKQQSVVLGIMPSSRSCTLGVYIRDEVLMEKTLRASEEYTDLQIDLPRAFEYRVEISGNFQLRVPKETPFVFEASAGKPAWIDYSGPHYFYVPRGVRELAVDAEPRLSLHIPGQNKRLDITPADRKPGKDYVVIPVPPGAAGKVWRTSSQTRGRVSLLNVPPLLSFHRHTLLVPREVSVAEDLPTVGR